MERKTEGKIPISYLIREIPCRLAAKRQGRVSSPLFDLSSLISANQLRPGTCATCWSSELVLPKVQLHLEQRLPF